MLNSLQHENCESKFFRRRELLNLTKHNQYVLDHSDTEARSLVTQKIVFRKL
jgi:hypothetical protein